LILKRTLGELAEFVGGRVVGDTSTEIVGCAPFEMAREGDITFVRVERYLARLDETRASAVITPPETTSAGKSVLWVKNPQLAFAKLLTLYCQKPYEPTGIHKSASISATARLGLDVSVGPCAVIGDHVVIGDRVDVRSGVHIGDDSSVGNDSVIHPNVSIYRGTTIGRRVILHSGVVVGSDGFGYVRDKDTHVKIPQTGGVTIEDDVEIGANSTIDRATMGQTIIKQGVKIDNLVQVAHNVVIGENTIVVAQVGIAGSTKVGRDVILAGQVGVADHIDIGDNVIVGAQAGVAKNISPHQVVQGSPSMPHRDFLRSSVLIPRLPQMKRIVDDLVRRIKALEERVGKK
jgi:UDP-3-O-[3-hydroxymyristoyl] glucosamine N-acyltransferase